MAFVTKNNAKSTVADNPLAQAAVTLNVAAGEGTKFPSTYPFLVTIWDATTYPDPGDDANMEIVKCTARTTDALTIVRAQEGTADVAHALGQKVAMLVTSGIIDAKNTYDAVVAASGADYTTIQSAIDDGKLNIFVRDGTYTLGADITFANDNTILNLESWATIIACGTDYKVNMNSKANCVIRNGKITGTGTTNGNIYSASDTSGLIENCYLDCSFGIEVAAGNYTRILHNYITGAAGRTAIYCRSSYKVIEGNIIKTFGSTTSGANVTAIDCGSISSVKGNSMIAIGNVLANTITGINGYQKNEVVGNLFEDFDTQSTSSGYIYPINLTTFNTISDNIFIDIGAATGYWIEGIKLSGGSENTIANNYFGAFGKNTVTTITELITVGSYNSIVGNYFDSCQSSTSGGTSYGIVVGGTVNTVVGNTFSEAAGATQAGIYFGNNENTASGNTFYVGANQWTTQIDLNGKFNNVYDNLGTTPALEQKTILAKNTDGDAMAAGDIVILKSVAAGNEVTHTTTIGDDKVYGMAVETIANNDWGFIQTFGKTAVLKANGTTDIAVGDYLSCYSASGIVQKAAVGHMAIAIALEAYSTDDSSGVIDALLITPRKI